MEVNLIMEAAKFMVLGMGVVFSFLIILIFVLKAQAALVAKYFPEKEKKPTVTKVHSNASSDSAKVAAIVAAVQHHNKS